MAYFGLLGSFEKSGAFIRNPMSRARVIRTATRRTPNAPKQQFVATGIGLNQAAPYAASSESAARRQANDREAPRPSEWTEKQSKADPKGSRYKNAKDLGSRMHNG